MFDVCLNIACQSMWICSDFTVPRVHIYVNISSESLADTNHDTLYYVTYSINRKLVTSYHRIIHYMYNHCTPPYTTIVYRTPIYTTLHIVTLCIIVQYTLYSVQYTSLYTYHHCTLYNGCTLF